MGGYDYTVIRFDLDNNEELCFCLWQVSWIRLADLKLLTVGNVTCTMLEYISPVQRMSLEAVVNFHPHLRHLLC